MVEFFWVVCEWVVIDLWCFDVEVVGECWFVVVVVDGVVCDGVVVEV